MMHHQKNLFISLAILLVFIFTVGAQGATINVPADQPTIQAAIDVASPGDEILVAPATYDEPLDIDTKNNITINGADKATTILKSSTTFGWNVAGYGETRQTMVRVVESQDITFQNLTFDFDLIKGAQKYGIFYWNSTGTIDNNIVKNIGVPGSVETEIGIRLMAPDYTPDNRAEVTVSNNEFVDTGRGAINTHYYVHSTISNNILYKTFADYGGGIEIGSGSTADITGNTVYGFNTTSTETGSWSTAIFIHNAFTNTISEPGFSKTVSIIDNEVYDSQFAVIIGNPWNGYAGAVDIVATVKSNNIHNNSIAIDLQDEDKSAGSSVTVNCEDNTISNNNNNGYYIITNGDGDITANIDGDDIIGNNIGIYMNDSSPASSSYNITVSNCNITGNAIYGAQNEYSGATITAANNWWGDDSGPSGVAAGTGDAVSNYIDYDPWVGKTTSGINVASGPTDVGIPDAIVNIEVTADGGTGYLDANQVGFPNGNVQGEDFGVTGCDRRSKILWTITETGDVTADLIFYYCQQIGVSDPSLLKLLKRENDGQPWTDVVTAVNDIPNCRFIVSDITEFSEWTVGGVGGENPLPVELSSFHAEVVKGGIKLHWSTASEINNKGFKVYKQSQQGSLLPCSDLIEGAGTTSEPQQYSFTDKDVQPDVLYTYQIADIEEGTGKETLHPAITIIASKEALQAKEIPEAFALHANYPNPFNPTTTIEFDVPVGTYNYTSLRIYDATGKLVKTLIDEPMDAGKYSVSWHGKDDSGKLVSSGVYYCKMITETYSETRQLVLLK